MELNLLRDNPTTDSNQGPVTMIPPGQFPYLVLAALRELAEAVPTPVDVSGTTGLFFRSAVSRFNVRDGCPLCDVTHWQPLTAYRHHGTVFLQRVCSRCGHVQTFDSSVLGLADLFTTTHDTKGESHGID